MSDIRERLRIANNVEKVKDKSPQERIKELEQENAILEQCVLELADIVGGGE